MKRKDLDAAIIARVTELGGTITFETGAKHDKAVINVKGKKRTVAIPRHKEINEITAKKILKQAEEG